MSQMRNITMIVATTVLSGLVLIGVILLVAPPVLGPILIVIARLPSPFFEIIWVAVLLPLVGIGPPILWFGIYRLLSQVCDRGRPARW
jgi:hypothetical protein